MNNLIVFKNGKMTITSLELVEQINLFREQEGRAELAHYDLLKIIRDEFEDEINEGEISLVDYKDKKGEKRPMYNLTTLHGIWLRRINVGTASFTSSTRASKDSSSNTRPGKFSLVATQTQAS